MQNNPKATDIKELKSEIKKLLAEVLEIDVAKIEDETSFVRLGLSTMDAILFAEDLSEKLGKEIKLTDVYNFDNVHELSEYLAKAPVDAEEERQRPDVESEPIAIIAMSCRFPEAENVEEYWKNLIGKKDCISTVPADRWDPEEVAKGTVEGKLQIKYGGFIKDVDLFDASFFHISPREAEFMDPQQRILLEQTQVLCEAAGYNTELLKGRDIGVFVGISQSNYAEITALNSDERNIYAATGNSLSVAANRVSYTFDFQGPSVAVDTACSSSLVAIHQAVRSIRSGECSMAVAGGVNLILTPFVNMCFSDAGLMASDGRCKTFDAAANGIARSEGCGLVLLKPLSKALADGDEVIATVKGTAVNQDGQSNGLTAPNGLSQQRLIKTALHDANLKPTDVNYVETHGTGTFLGDPIEVQAIGKVYGEKQGRRLLLGAAKANLGHLEAAAGIVGVIKAALALKHRQLPGQINYTNPNPQIRWDDFNLGVEIGTVDFAEGPLHAGVSSFGFGGTNAHLILGAPEANGNGATAPRSDRNTHLLPLSAASSAALKQQAVQVLQLTDAQPDYSLYDLARSYSVHKAHYAKRVGLTAKTPEQLKEALTAFVQGEEHGSVFVQDTKLKYRKTAFLFTGAGSQFAGMGKVFYDAEPVFKKAMDSCFDAAAHHMDVDLKSIIFCEPGSEEEKLLNRIDIMQPAIFAFEYAMYKWWETTGIIPEMVIGHSLGEIVAACVAGVFDLKDAMRLTVLRGQLILNMEEPGTMASIQAPEEEVLKLIEGKEDRVAIGVLNGRNQSVVSGRVEDVEAVVAQFDAKGVKTKILNIARAGHSPLMDQICEPFREVLKTFNMRPGTIPLVSNTTGQVAGEEISTPQYWVDHLRKTVRFADGLHTLVENECDILIEMGPMPTLLGIAGFVIEGEGDFLYLPSATAGDEGAVTAFDSVAKYYSHGGDINWMSFMRNAGGKCMATPPYPFRRSRYWIEKRSGKSLSGLTKTGAPVLSAYLKVAGNLRVYELPLSIKEFPYLRHHRVLDAVIAPPSFVIEAILEYIAVNDLKASIKNIEFERQLFLEEGMEKEVQINASINQETLKTSIEVYSFNPVKQDWLLHARAELGVEDSTMAAVLNVEEAKAALTADTNIDAFYSSLAEKGLQYGESFKTLREIYTSDNESLALVSLSESASDEAAKPGYQLHPTLIEAAMQLLLHREKGATDLYTMLSAERVQMVKVPGDEVWVSLKPEGDNKYRAAYFDGEGNYLAGFVFTCRQATASQMSSSSSRLRTDWMYEPFWKSITADGFIPKIESWLILCNDKRKEQYADFFKGLDEKEVPYVVYKDWDVAYKVMNEKAFDFITVIWDEADYSTTDPVAAHRSMALAGLKQLQELNKLLSSRSDMKIRTLHWVTEGFSAGDLSLPSAAIWALGRIFVRESIIDLKLIDVDHGKLDKGGFMQKLLTLETENEVRIIDDNVEVQRLRKRSIATDKPKQVGDEGTYIITGGLSGLGLLSARWIAENTSVKQVALWARSKPSDSALKAIEEIKSGGTEVLVQQVDVADASRVEAAMAEANGAFPVKGIIHAAGVSKDAFIDDQTAELLDAVAPPKVQGSMNLHESSKKYELENFIIFSTFSAMPGLSGVANYAVANLFADQLADIRAEAGLPCCAINWGPWGLATAMVTADRFKEFTDYMAQKGLGMLDPEQGMNLFGYAMEYELSGSGYLFAPLMLGDSNPFRLPSGKVAPIYRDLFADLSSAEEFEVVNLKVILAHTPPDERLEVLVKAIRQQVFMVAKIEDPEAMDDDDDFFSLGVDSLMAAELINRLSRMLKTHLSATVVFDHRSINELANWLVNKKLDFESEAAEELSAEEKAAIQEQLSELTGEAQPAAAPGSNGAPAGAEKQAGPDWQNILHNAIAKELEQHGKSAEEIEKSGQFRRRLTRLVSTLTKKTEG